MARVFSILPIGLLVLCLLLLRCQNAAARRGRDGDDDERRDPDNARIHYRAGDGHKKAKNKKHNPSCEKPCMREFDPVCGSDGVTYSNICNLNNKIDCKLPHMEKLYDGACGKDFCNTTCNDEAPGLCGSDGTTYEGYCKFRIARCDNEELTVEHEGNCE